jgi:hypothetical protein
MKAIKYCGRKYQRTHYNKIKRNDTINDRGKIFQGLLKVHQVKNLFLTQSIKNLEILLTKILRVVYILRVKKIIFKFLIEYKSAV